MAANPLDLYPEVTAVALQARLNYRRKHSGKTCDRCKEGKPLSSFSRDSREPDGLSRICRGCKSIANSEAYKRRVSRNTG